MFRVRFPGMVIALGLSLCASTANATAILPPAPATGWCYESIAADGYSGVRGCPEAPPPVTPPIDPLGMNTIIGKFASHDCHTISTSNGQDFGALFGQVEGGGLTVPVFPWRANSLGFTLAPGRRYSAVMNVGLNPGITPRFIKGDAYGGSCRPALSASAHFTWAIERTVVTDPVPTGRCSGASFFGDRSYFVQINPSDSPTTDRPQACNLRFGKSYRFWLDGEGTGAVPVILTMN